ncbi:MAG TPA: hypothetical protein VME46_18685, partial [Acidimicrobiales bacterium]|nr:hypothetical protein [Acidimicrobiales bacterium]
WGRQLSGPIVELGRWAARLMGQKSEAESFRNQWMAVPVAMMFGGHDPDRAKLVVEIRSEGGAGILESSRGEVHFRPGPATAPDVVVSGPPDVIIGLLAGRLDKSTAAQHGVSVLGDFRRVARLRQRDWMSGPPGRSPLGTRRGHVPTSFMTRPVPPSGGRTQPGRLVD